MTESLSITAADELLSAELKQLNAEFLDLFTRHRDMVDSESARFNLILCTIF